MKELPKLININFGSRHLLQEGSSIFEPQNHKRAQHAGGLQNSPSQARSLQVVIP
jgi:hypothetical protein